jgi:transposase
MQGQKHIQPKMLYQLSIEELVPSDNFYRQLGLALDLSFIRKETAKYYGTEGQESIDPVVFFKICLVGYLNNINSDRRLIQYCANCLDIRLYLHYDIDEALPWHSTISRTRQLYGEEIFLFLFQKVLSLCVQKGMVKGKRQAIDSAFIKANASLDSMIEKDVLEDVKLYAKELNEGSEFEIKTVNAPLQIDSDNINKNNDIGESESRANDENISKPKPVKNQTHYSSTDPDARMSVKPGKACNLNYYGQIAVDDANHVITGAMADFADKRDSQCLPQILQQTIDNLNQYAIRIEQICADTNYSSGDALRFAVENNIDAYIPNIGSYKPTRPGFLYNQELDQWECQRGKKAILTFKRIETKENGGAKKIYSSSPAECKNCPLNKNCLSKKAKYKNINETIDKPYYDKMHEKMQTIYAKRIGKIRSRTVEPVLGTLINFTNMKRVNTRGIKHANKHVLMAALTYNLKKYLKFKTFNSSQLEITMIKKVVENVDTKIKTFLIRIQTTLNEINLCISANNFLFFI